MAGLDRTAALGLLHEYTQSESLRKHALAVEACCRAYAPEAERDLWGLTGLLHDFDYERWPNLPDHPLQGNKILTGLGYPEALRHAILAHCEQTGAKRESPLDKTLFACDELSGFLTACALVKPSKSIAEVEPASVRRKLKDKAFARSVSRDDITRGAAELGLPLEAHIANCLAALRSIAPSLGL
ncbi:MAG: HD domain-containing protein [Acidobacteria bacterium]|nr:MAG: HD domain-containing protein [Acidobacteriota bacterium]